MDNMFAWPGLLAAEQQQPSSTNRNVHQQLDHQSPSSTAMVIEDWTTPATTKDRPAPPLTAASQSTTTVAGSNSPTAPTVSATTSTIELSDFPTLDDFAGATNNNSMISPPFYPGYNYYSMPYPYWGAPQSTTVPVSNYSTLNGATNPTGPTTSQPQGQHQPARQTTIETADLQSHSSHSQSSTPQTQGQPQQQPQHPGGSQSMSVDSSHHATMSMNGSSSNGAQYNNPPTVPSNFPQHSSSHHTPYGYAHLQPYATTTPYYRPPQTSVQQGTLSPQVLLNTSSLAGGIPPSSFYGHPVAPSPSTSTSSGPQTPQPQQQAQHPQVSVMQQQQEQQRKEQEALERKEKFQTNVRSLLQTFSGGGSVNALVKLINDYGVTEVDAPMRLEILNKMRDNAGNHYFRAWSEKPAAVEITREWLKAAAKGEKPNLEETIMPLLHVIDRLPFTLETLTASKIGKVVRYINKETAFSPGEFDAPFFTLFAVQTNWRERVKLVWILSTTAMVHTNSLEIEKCGLSGPFRTELVREFSLQPLFFSITLKLLHPSDGKRTKTQWKTYPSFSGQSSVIVNHVSNFFVLSPSFLCFPNPSAPESMKIRNETKQRTRSHQGYGLQPGKQMAANVDQGRPGLQGAA
ncbi:TKL/TKL-ccin protein kinase [Coprinopsis cinerea AmutBmut pab1-1]|nr:TKL/TKL-ccin protein kinase [Coprinopsis cinerea AmutBmut pab1-1]